MTSLARVLSAELEGISASLIEVEVDLNIGLHSFTIVGLGDKAVAEAKERVNSALKNSGVKPPNQENRRITVNLAPADVRKTGSQYDLAIAIGYMLATGQLKDFDRASTVFVGELALDGRVRPITGSLAIAEMTRMKGLKRIFLPVQNFGEGSVIDDLEIVPVENIIQAISILEGGSAPLHPENIPRISASSGFPDIGDICGQENGKRAITIAASGGHTLLMTGPPGTGKSLLAGALGGILPELERDEAIEVTKIWSAAGIALPGLITKRPFRSPHETASPASIIGGGSEPRPGEISLAHNGILFLDELPEFQRSVLESLRSPLENGVVQIARAKSTLIFPARFTLIAAMNPCPCGFYGDPDKECLCTAADIARYEKRLSGPLLDRIDIHIRVPRIPIKELHSGLLRNKESDEVRKMVANARLIQRARFRGHPQKIFLNSCMSTRDIKKYCVLDSEAESLVLSLAEDHLSPRGYYRLLKTARTIADLDSSEKIMPQHAAEAFGYKAKK